MNKETPYQVMQPLTPSEYEALKESIKQHGVLVAIEFDSETNACLDGHNRLAICRELGITDYPRIIRAFSPGDEAAKRTHARSLNMARRHLSKEQKRRLIKEQLQDTPSTSDRSIAAALAVSNSTVSTLRRELEKTGEIEEIQKSVGADGKTRSRPVIATLYNPTDRQKRALKKPGVAERMETDGLTSAKNALARIHKEEKNERKDPDAYKITTDDVRLIHADIREGIPQIKDESIHLCLTDAPYAKAYTTAESKENDVYEPLSRLCNRVLVDSGSLLCMTGLYYLPEVIASLGTHLAYHWTLSLQLSKSSSKTFDKFMAAHWKPILFYTKGKLVGGDLYEDVYISPPYNPEDRKYHPHGQSLEIFTELAYRHSNSGECILDPFVGGGTTALAAISQGRRFIGCDVERKHLETTQKRIKQAFDLDIPIE